MRLGRNATRNQCERDEMQSAILFTTLEPQGHEQNKPRNQNIYKKKHKQEENKIPALIEPTLPALIIT